MIMMIAPDYVVCQKEGAQGKEEEGGRRNGGTTGADAPIGPTWSEVSDARNRRKYGGWCWILIHRRDMIIVCPSLFEHSP